MKRNHNFTFSILLFPFSVLLCGMGVASCSRLTDGTKQEDVALQAAKAYYDQLVHGDYNAFVEGSLHGDSVPADFKEQLLVNAQMFIEQQQETHQGIDKIEAVKATCDSTKVTPANSGSAAAANKDSVLVTAETYLTLYYKDGSQEEISVPMVRKNNIWYLR